MLNLALTTDKLQLVTSAAAAIDVHVSYADLIAGAVTPNKQNTAITTATTTDIVAVPGSGVRNVKAINVRNKDASLSCDVTVLYNQNSTTFELHKATLVPGALLEFVEGVGFFTISSAITNLKNQSTANQTLSTVDIYLTGSSIAVPANLPLVGTTYKVVVTMAKTAGTGAETFNVRYGTAGAIGDASRGLLTFSTGTSVADNATWTFICVFRSIGSGTSAVIESNGFMQNNLPNTGFSGVAATRVAEVTGGGFDSTVANSFIGLSYNGSTAFAGTAFVVRAELIA